MTDPITIGSVMTAHPYFIEIDSHLNSAKVMLAQYNLRHMPVKNDDNNIVGIISLRDIERAEMHGVDTSIGTDVLVREVCQPATFIVEPDTPLKTVLQKMADEQLECVVIATDNHLQGIFTVTDACKHYAQSLE